MNKDIHRSSLVKTARIEELLVDHDSRIEEIVELINNNQMLASRIMSQANSVVSASLMPIKTVKEAVVRLGRTRILNMASLL